MYRKPTRKYWRAYGALVGGQLELAELEKDLKKAPKKKAASDCPNEQQEQFSFVHWLRKNNIPHHHSPNGGYRDYREAAKFKRLGVSAGFPDIFIPVPRKGKGGLFIELKRVSGGSLSEAQKEWGKLLLKNGFAWYEAKGCSVAIEIVTSYFDGDFSNLITYKEVEHEQ